jgi:hypothetical protein
VAFYCNNLPGRYIKNNANHQKKKKKVLKLQEAFSAPPFAV